MRWMALGVALVLAGCAPSTPEGQCSSAVNDDPVVKAIIIKGTGNPHYQMESQDELRAAKQDALVKCLKGRGVIRGGGVERQKPL